MVDNFGNWAEELRKVYTDAVAVAESLKEAANEDRNKASLELEAAKAAKKAAEDNGEKIALDYFARRHKELVAQTRKEMLSTIVLRNLKEGKKEDDIMKWLDVDQNLIQYCTMVLKKEKEIADRPHLEYSQEGRGGTISYIAGTTKITFDWEFAGGAGVALIFIPEEKFWLAHTHTPVSERISILTFVAKQVIEDKAPGCAYEVTDNCIEILYR